MCKALAKQENVGKVACMLNNFTKEEAKDAQIHNVDLFEKEDNDRSNKLSEINPNVVIDHGIHELANPMRSLKELLEAKKIKHKTVFILHVAPFALQSKKQLTGASTKAEEKEQRLKGEAKSADVVAAVGPRLAKYWAQNFSIKRQKFVRLNPGLYDDDVHVKQQHQVANQPLQCLFVSRLENDEDKESKGLYVAVEAMKKYNDKLKSRRSGAGAVFTVRGFKDGEACDEFMKTAGSLENILIKPKAYSADEDAVKDDMEAADVFLMPSKEEGFGLTALEALSVGTPVICSRNSGFAEVLEEIGESDEDIDQFITTKWIVEGDSGTQLFDCLWSMLQTRQTIKTTFQEAKTLQRQWKQRYSWSTMVTDLLDNLGA